MRTLLCTRRRKVAAATSVLALRAAVAVAACVISGSCAGLARLEQLQAISVTPA